MVNYHVSYAVNYTVNSIVNHLVNHVENNTVNYVVNQLVYYAVYYPNFRRSLRRILRRGLRTSIGRSLQLAYEVVYDIIYDVGIFNISIQFLNILSLDLIKLLNFFLYTDFHQCTKKKSSRTQIAKCAYSASVTTRTGADYASSVRSPRHADVSSYATHIAGT